MNKLLVGANTNSGVGLPGARAGNWAERVKAPFWSCDNGGNFPRYWLETGLSLI